MWYKQSDHPLRAVLLIVPAYIRVLHLSTSLTATKCLCHWQRLAQPRGKKTATAGKSLKEWGLLVSANLEISLIAQLKKRNGGIKSPKILFFLINWYS